MSESVNLSSFWPGRFSNLGIEQLASRLEVGAGVYLNFEFYICEIYNLAAKDPAGGQESSLFVGLFVYTRLFQNLKISRKKPQNVVVFARSACIFEGSMHSKIKMDGWKW